MAMFDTIIIENRFFQTYDLVNLCNTYRLSECGTFLTDIETRNTLFIKDLEVIDNIGYIEAWDCTEGEASTDVCARIFEDKILFFKEEYIKVCNPISRKEALKTQEVVLCEKNLFKNV